MQLSSVGSKLLWCFSERHTLPLAKPIRTLSWPVQLAIIGSVASVFMGYNLSVFNTPFHMVATDFGLCGLVDENWIANVVVLQPFCSDAVAKQSLINGTFILCAAIGSLMSGPMMGRLGRRTSLLFVYANMCMAVMIGALAMRFEHLLLSRIISGIASGMATVIPAVYITEMAPPLSRATFSLIPQIAVNIGIVMGICMGLPLHIPNDEENVLSLSISAWSFNRLWWRFMLFASAPFCCIAALLLVRPYSFDTPAYMRLTGRSKAAAALEALIFVDEQQNSDLSSIDYRPVSGKTIGRKSSGADGIELSAVIEQSVTNSGRSQSSSALSLPHVLLASPALRYRLLVGWILAVLQQLTGINVFVAASNSIFASAGLSRDKLSLASAAMASLGLTCSIIAPSFISKIPRRALLTGGAFAMFLSFLPVIICNCTLSADSPIHQLMAVVSTLFFIAAYGLSYGPGLFLYLNELFPIEIKDPGLAVAFTFNWLTCFSIVTFAPTLSQKQAFTIFSIVSFCCAIFAYSFAPETKPTVPQIGTALPSDDSDEEEEQGNNKLENSSDACTIP